MKELILKHFPGCKYSLEKNNSGFFNTVLFNEYSIFISTIYDHPFLATVFYKQKRIGFLIEDGSLDNVFNKINHTILANENNLT